jgi:cell division protease FtsH
MHWALVFMVKTTHQNLSDRTAQQVDDEIRRIIDEQYDRARKIIEDNRDKIEIMTKALLEWETIDANQINEIMAGKKPTPPQSQSGDSSDGSGGKPEAPKTESGPNLDTPASEH